MMTLKIGWHPWLICIVCTVLQCSGFWWGSHIVMYYWKEFGFLLFLVAMWPEVALDRVGRLEAVVLGSSLVGAIGPSRVVAQPEIKYQAVWWTAQLTCHACGRCELWRQAQNPPAPPPCGRVSLPAATSNSTHTPAMPTQQRNESFFFLLYCQRKTSIGRTRGGKRPVRLRLFRSTF